LLTGISRTAPEHNNDLLSLDTPVFPPPPHKPLAGEEGKVDPRLNTITVRPVLQLRVENNNSSKIRLFLIEF
jgi:hypothetical protein